MPLLGDVAICEILEFSQHQVPIQIKVPEHKAHCVEVNSALDYKKAIEHHGKGKSLYIGLQGRCPLHVSKRTALLSVQTGSGADTASYRTGKDVSFAEDKVVGPGC
jgi:hypothetical protein